VAIVAGTGVEHSGLAEEIIFIQGSGGPVDISASPQVEAGLTTGQRLTLICTSDTNTVKFEDGTGLALNGEFTMAAECVLKLIWVSGLNEWMEEGRVER
jgi:hypothetical protein